MNTSHRRTLASVFASPTPMNLEWSWIEALLVACGCRITEGAGSRVRISKNADMLNVHRPHPAKEAKPYLVRDVRAFLERLGVRPEKETP